MPITEGRRCEKRARTGHPMPDRSGSHTSTCRSDSQPGGLGIPPSGLAVPAITPELPAVRGELTTRPGCPLRLRRIVTVRPRNFLGPNLPGGRTGCCRAPGRLSVTLVASGGCCGSLPWRPEAGQPAVIGLAEVSLVFRHERQAG